MRRLRFFTLFLIVLVMSSCGENKTHADLILTDARVYTVNDSAWVAEAFAVKEGRFIAVGSSEEILSAYSSDTIIHLEGKPVYPGFIDPHCHFWGYGTVLQQADLAGVKSREELHTELKDFAHKNPDISWLTGRGWDNTMWKDQTLPDNARLNEKYPDKPVVLRRVDGHAVLANKKAIEMADMETESTKGNPPGIFLDNEAQKILDQIPELNKKQKTQALLDAQSDCFGVGLTSVHDAGMSRQWIQLIDSLQKSGKLNMRIYAMLNPTAENFELMRQGGINNDNLHVQSIKLYADGALGSRGAKLIKPYTDKPSTNGLLVMPSEDIEDYCRKAAEAGFQVNTHAIGDSAVRMMLDIYSSFVREKKDHRWRIEHSQIVHPDDMERFGRLEIIPSIQTTHATSDMDWAGERLGKERLKNAYVYSDLLKQNGWLPNGSDFPVEDINPLYGFYAGISRKDTAGHPENGFMAKQALSRKEALKAMTIWAAKAAFEEKEKGSIEQGKMADFVVMDRDIMKVPQRETFKAEIRQTYLAGTKVYNQGTETGEVNQR